MRGQKQTSLVITDRDYALFGKLAAAGWLTTGQIRDYFFPGKSMNAVSKRLRKLVEGNYLALARTSSTELGLYRLAGQGKQALLEHAQYSEEAVSIPNHLPRKLKHFIAINNLRLYFEQNIGGSSAQVLSFFTEREYARSRSIFDSYISLLKSYKIIPDALAKIRCANGDDTWELTLAIEYDAGTEQAAFFGRTKVKQYAALFAQNRDYIDDFKVLTFTDSTGRIVSLMRETIKHLPPHNLFYYALIDKLSHDPWAESEIFLDPYDFFASVRRGDHLTIMEKEIHADALPTHALLALPAVSPHSVSPRGEREEQITLSNQENYRHSDSAVI